METAQSPLTFTDRLIEGIRVKKSILNVGLDPQVQFIPPHFCEVAQTLAKHNPFEAVARAFLMFNEHIIDAVEPFAVSVKPQIAFYEAYGMWGIWAFEETIKYARSRGLQVITDAKRGDGGDTAQAYADGHLGEVPLFDGARSASPLRVDALTVHAWIGTSCVSPFIKAVKHYGTGVFIVDKTSFVPNSEIEQTITSAGDHNWEMLANLVKSWGEGTEGSYGYRNFGVVMGATYPEDAPKMRKILPNSWMLVPGYGAQGGGSDGAVTVINDDGFGGIVSSSRAVIAAWLKGPLKRDPVYFVEAAALAAEASRDDLNAALKRAGKLNW